MTRTFKTLSLLCGALLLGALLAGCGPKDEKTVSTEDIRKEQGYPVKVVVAQIKDLSRDVHFTGTVNLPDTLNVTPQVGGVIKEIYVDKGDRVSKNDPLLKIDPTDYQNGVRQAEAAVSAARVALQIAQKRQNLNEQNLASNMADAARAGYEYDKWNLQRMEKLFEAGVISEQDLVGMRTKVETSKKNLDSAMIQSRIGDAGTKQLEVDAARAQLKQAEAALAFARTSLSRTVVRSEIDGVISLRMTVNGAMIGPESAVFQILRDGDKKVSLMLNEDDLPKIRQGQSVEFSSTALPGKKFTADISYVPTFVFEQNRQAPVEAIITGNAEGLKHGMFVEGDIKLTPEPFLVIPYKAVLENEIVWVAGKDGKAAKRTCKKHTRIMNFSAIQDGCVKPGDRVVYQGQNLLSKDAKLDIRESTQKY
jgi:multidrug efflux pump subunit AcrA (membrane-fusion protein)